MLVILHYLEQVHISKHKCGVRQSGNDKKTNLSQGTPDNTQVTFVSPAQANTTLKIVLLLTLLNFLKDCGIKCCFIF